MKNPNLMIVQAAIVVCIFFVISSCGKNDEKEIPVISGGISSQRTKLLVDTLSYTIDNRSSGSSFSMMYLNDSIPKIAWFNDVNSSIDFYEIDNSVLSKRIQIERDGPNGVGEGDLGVYILNEDSILVSNKMTLYLINKEAIVLRKWILDMVELGGYPDFEISSIKKPVINNTSLVVSVYPQKSAFKLEHLRKWLNFIKIDLSGNEEPVAFGNLPNYLKNNIVGFNYLNKSFVTTKKDIIVSYLGVKDLFKIPLDQLDSIGLITLQTGDFENVSEIPGSNKSEFMNYTKHYLLNQSFDGIYFNGQDYLRICQKGISEESLNLRKWAKEKVLMFYDEDFNLITEWQLNSTFGNYMMTVATDDGFLIKVDSGDENIIKFMRIRIEKEGEI